jgi:hypothetical protein
MFYVLLTSQNKNVCSKKWAVFRKQSLLLMKAGIKSKVIVNMLINDLRV